MASAVFNQVFGCCLHRKTSKARIREHPDERSRLIPATVEPSSISSPDLQVVERERLKERLGSIVRSKEGKMVNVSARLPFNLHNRNVSATSNDPSLPSRSTSTSTTHRPSLRSLPLSSTPHIHAYVGAPLTGISNANDSRSSSRGTSRTGSEAAQRTPTLDLRLVRAIPISATSARRGRALKKASDHSGNGVEAALDGKDEEIPDLEHEHMLSSPSSTITAQASREYHIPSPSSSSSGSVASSFDDKRKPTLAISPASTIEFTLRDPGPLSVSWGE